MGDIPRYPPFTEGLPTATPKALLDTQESLIRQLKHELALTPEQEKTLVDPLLLSYASFVHLLPASKAHHHRGAGGMLRHGLEVALWSTRGFHGRIIDGHESGERRKVLEPRWRLAVAVAGLCHDIGKTAYDVVVTDATGKKVWDVYGGLLSEWIETEKLDRYFISWRSGREHKVHERFGHLLTMRVIPREVLSYLNEADPRIIAVMHETIAGQIPKGAAKVVHELVMSADQRSVQRDIKGQRVADSDSALGVPVAKYLVDAMKRLIDQGKWRANQEGQPLWVTGSGVYLDWDQAVPQMIELLLADGVSGIPRSQDSVAESLSDFDVIQKQVTSDGVETYYIPVAPEKLCSKKKVHQFRGVELTGLDILFDGPHPAPVDVHVGVGAVEAREAVNEKRDKKLAEERNERALKRHDEKVAQSDGESRPIMPDEPPESESDADETDTASSEPEVRRPEAADLEALSKAKSKPAAPAETSDEAPAEEETPKPSWLESLSAEQREIIESCFVPGQSEHAQVHGGDVIVKYPDGLSHYGDQRNARLDVIKPLLAPHPTVPEKPTQKRKVSGKEVNVLVLSGEAAACVRSLSPAKASPEKVSKAPAKPKQPRKAAQKPKPQSPPKPAPEAQKSPKAQTPPAKGDKSEQETSVTEQAPNKPAKPKHQTPKKPKAPEKPPAQKPPKVATSEDPILIEFKEKILAEYPDDRIEDSKQGGYWVSAPDAAKWYVKNVRPDISFSPLLTALYKQNQKTKQLSPNGDTDYVLLKPNS